MAARSDKGFSLEGCELLYRNFEGRPGPYNKEGERGFVVVLPPELAAQLEEDGWNVRHPNPRDEEDPGNPTLAVAVWFNRSPRIVMISGERKVVLDEDTAMVLDWADIVNADLYAKPHYWDRNGRSGIKAYVQSLYVTVDEDPIRLKYEG